MSAEIAIAAVAVSVQIIALTLAVLGIISASKRHMQESEDRVIARINALEVRAAMLETKVQRAEDDIQRVWKRLPKRVGE